MNINLSARNKPIARVVQLRTLLSLHRRMGIVSALFVILLSVSGLMLHHSPRLQLDNLFLSSPALLNWYGLEVPAITKSFSADDHSASLIADALYFDNSRVDGNYTDLRGMAPFELGYVLATANQLLLITSDAELIEVLASVHGVPAGIQKIGQTNSGQLVLQTPLGIELVDLEGPTFVALEQSPTVVSWSTVTILDDAMRSAVGADYAGSLLSWERLILDIHSGRVLGGVGAVLVDIMALLFVLMAVSGVWIWSRRRS